MSLLRDLSYSFVAGGDDTGMGIMGELTDLCMDRNIIKVDSLQIVPPILEESLARYRNRV